METSLNNGFQSFHTSFALNVFFYLFLTCYRMNKDEKLAREAGIKLNIKVYQGLHINVLLMVFLQQDIVDPPMDEFNDMLSKEDLSEEQLNICRDIRRRGKNKVAAQNCRKRKLEQIDELQRKVEEARQRRHQLRNEHEKYWSRD